MQTRSTILIVEDDPGGRKILSSLLRPQGYQLFFATDGATALAQAAAHPPDLVLLDVMLPDLDGYEICRRLREDPRTAEVAIIMVTALDDRASRIQGLEVGADDFLSKPIDYVELRARVHTICRLNRFRRLQAERSRFEWVVEHADDGYVIVDERDHLLYANPRARHFLGLPSEGPIAAGTLFLALADRHYQREPREAWEAWPATTSVPLYLVFPESPMSQACWLKVERLALPPPTDHTRIIRLRDVTDQMYQQCETWQLHVAINHKLRTPLVGIIGGLNLLAARADALSPQQTREIANIAYESVLRLRDSVEDVFEYMTAGGPAPIGTGFDLAELPALVGDLASAFNLAPAVSLPADLEKARIVLPRRLVEVVLRELLENAHKFHPEQSPHVEVVASCGEGGQIRIEVRDDGQTLSPEQLLRVGIPHYQGERWNTGQIPGMGLGLATVAAILWRVQGAIQIANRVPGPGVVVELSVPQALDIPALREALST